MPTDPILPGQIVRDYLSAMEARDLETALGFLRDDFTMTFPGGATFSRPDQLVDWAKSRYQSVGKTYSGFDELPDPDGAIVYCYGTLHGVWLDGSNFSDIRFIDRFKVKDGKLTDQQVWNDMGEQAP
jgi:uncharacterized protein DUF4440